MTEIKMKLNSARSLTMLVLFVALFLVDISVQEESLLEKIADIKHKNSLSKFLFLNDQKLQEKSKFSFFFNKKYLSYKKKFLFRISEKK